MAKTDKVRGSAMDWLSQQPIAHRGLHDPKAGIPENTLAAARAAAEHGYGIEADLHPSRDGVPVVFHDLTLDRLTGQQGCVRDRTAKELTGLTIAGTTQHIPTLDELLAEIDGRAGLVLELKGLYGHDDGFADAVTRRLSRYRGPAAAMSFDHWLLRDLRAVGGSVPLGLTAEGDDSAYLKLREIDDELSFDFLSYGLHDLPCRFATEFVASSRPMIVWTVRTAQQAARAWRNKGQITFESFLP